LTVQTRIETWTNPSKNEKPLLPQPEPSMTVVNTHFGLCLFGVRMRRAMQMQIDAMTVHALVEVSRSGDMWRTIDGRKPKNDAMQPVRGKGADGAKHAEYEYSEKNCLPCLPIMRVSRVTMGNVMERIRYESRPFVIHGVHNNSGQDHLRDGIGQTGNSGCLTEEVAPTDDPGPGGNMVRGHNMFCDIVHSSSCGICRYQLGNWEDALTTSQ
jgi:hypothetical protein